MNRELALSAKKYNFLEKLQQNQYVDAIDDGRWKVAKIIGFKIVGHRHSIRLHFDAFPNSWDQDFDLPASTKLAPFRRFTLPYTGPFEEKKILHRPVPSLNLQAPLSDLRKLTKADKQKIKPQFIIQNFRGELFILIDTFLTQNIKHRPEQFEIVFRFLEVYIEVGIHVLKFALQKFPEISKQYINDPNIIYVNPTYALISSLPQILFNFNSMISIKEKRVKFFLLGEGAPQQSRKKIKAYLKSKDIIAICQTILSFQTPPYRGFSWSIKKQALILLSGLQQQIEFPKITDSRQISDALDVLGYLKLKQAFSEQTIQNINIELVLSLILSGNFEGKLKGLAQVKKICEGTVFIKKQIIKEKILSQNLLYALTDNATFNSEVFKRSIPVFEAAARHQLLTDEILKRIINLHKDKHELQLKSYYTTLTQFGSFLNEKKVIQFFEEIKKFAIDTDSIELVKEFTRNVITNHPIYKKKYMSEETGFGLVYLWQVINNHTSPEIVTQAILAFSVLAGDIYYRQVIQRFLVQCFTNIKNGKNIESSLKIIHSCLNKNREIVHLVENIDRQFSIIDILVKSLIEQQSISSKTIESIFEFIEQVNQHARKKITVDHIKDLWMLKQCHRNLLKFLRKYTLSKQQKSNQKIILKKLSPTQIRQIFAKIFLNKQLMNNYMNCDDELFKTIDELLISYNHRSRAIDYNVKHCIRCILPYEVFGVEVFLDIAMGCRDQAIVDKALTRFVQYFIRPFKSKMSGCKLDKIGLWMLCADKINKYMDQSSLKYLGYSIIFRQIKGRMKSINILDPSEASFTVYAKQSNQRKVINIQRCSSLWKLRQIIDYQFKLNKTNFEMFVTEKRTITDMQTEQDFSVAYLESKDSSSVAVVITQSKQPHPHYISIQSFKNEFSQMFAQKIYDNLHTIKGSEIQSVTLQLLLSLPMIKNLEIKTSKLEIGKQITWDQILDVQCKSKLSYQLFVLNKVKTQGIPWVQGFIKKGGVQHIEKILRQRVQSKMSLSIKDYQVLTQLLEFFNQVIQFIRLHQPILPFNEAAVIEIMKLSPKQKSNPALLQDPVFLDYFYLTFTSLKQMVAYYPIDGLKILSNPNIIEVLELLLFTEKITQIQTRFPSVLLTIGQKSQGAALISQQCEIFLSNCESNIKLKYSCRVFFDLLVLLFDNNFVTNDLYNKTLKFIESTRFAPIQVYSEKQNSTNQLIRGWLRMCKCLLLKSITDHHQLKCIPQPQQKFADFLIRNGLFGQGHLFENEKSRAEAFDILSQLSCKKHIVENIDKLIVPIITKGSWRRQYQWYVKSFKKRKNNSEVGLKNLAATCYINSMLQQLYHIKQFSQALLEIDTSQIETSENIAYEVQKIFAYLKYSNRQVYTTQGLCDTFISDGQPIDPRIQMDIDQFFHTLMDKLEHNLMKINKQSIIDQVFKGEYSNLIIGQDCQHKSERIQNFLSMRLEIIKKTSLTQALTEFIKGQVLQGENAYFCEKCDKKIKAVKRVCVKSLPQVLILTLKRFQFDFDRMEKFKLNSFCEFDEYLDMLPYMRQSLYDKDEKLPSQNYKYKLKGVVIHYGVSEAGHYTSYIRIQNGEWKYFDDDKISNFDFKQLGNECFGGPDDNPYSDTSQKLKNAYLLIYERVNKPKAIQNVTSSKIKAEVDAENLNNQQIKVIFDQGLQTFFDTHAQVLGKTYILFVHLVSLRSQKRSTIYKRCYENCVSILQKNPSLIQWYLEQFSENLIKEFLIFSHPEVSNMVASIITYCVGKHFNADFIKRCMKCMDRKNMMALCKVFQASAFNPAYGKVLAEYSFGEKIFKIIKQDKAPNQGSLSKLQISRSQFGQPYSDFYDKKDMRNSIELIECIQFFKFKNFPQEEVEPMIRRAKKFVTQIYLAKFIASKFRDDESVQFLVHKIIFPMITKLQPKFQEQYMFRFVIILMAKMCEIKDQGIKRRAGYVAELYLLGIKQSLDGYKAMRYLILGLFSLAFNNQVFREEFINVLNSKDNKKYIKSIRDWMKEADRFYMHVKSDKMGYWRRIGRSSYAALERMDADPKISSQKYLSLFNSLLERHKIDFPDLWAPNIRKGQIVQLSQFAQDIYQVVDKFGLILHLKSAEESERYILEDDVFPIRSI